MASIPCFILAPIPSCRFEVRSRCADWDLCSARISAEHRSPRRRRASYGGRPRRASWHRRCRTGSAGPSSSRVRRSAWTHGYRAGADRCRQWATNRPANAPWWVPTSAAWPSRTNRWRLWAADRDAHSPWNRTSDRWSRYISPAKEINNNKFNFLIKQRKLHTHAHILLVKCPALARF